MSARFEELAWQDTRMGEISLRRRLDPVLHVDVYEVKLGEEFLMSSLFTVAEIELARLGLAALAEVIGWHERRLLPDVVALTGDPRTRLRHGDFFALAASGDGFDPEAPGRRFDAVLLDVDHSPRHVLHPGHAGFYTVDGLGRLAAHLAPGGVFALWSDDPPDADFVAVAEQVFTDVAAHVVRFPNPLTGGESANTVYTAHGG